MDERDWKSYGGDVHPAYCTCVSCVAQRSGHKPRRKVWRGRDVAPEGDSYWGVVNRQARQVARGTQERERDRVRVPRIPRRSILAVLLTLAIGAALAVLVIYPLLPHDAQARVDQAQEKVAELAPWLPSR